MKRKNENTNLSLNDWVVACLEIEELAPEHFEILTSIKPYMPEQDSSFIYFTAEDAKLLSSIMRQLPPEAVKHTSALMQMYARAPYIPAQKLNLVTENQYLELPAKITRKYIIPKMDRPTLSALMSTCRFFSTSKSLQSLRDSMPKYQVCAGESHTLIFTHNKLLVCGDNYNGQLGLRHTNEQRSFIDTLPGVLRKGETIVQVAAGPNHTLVLTSQQRLLVCGRNYSGQLGLGHTKNQDHFVDALEGVLLEGETVLQIAAGDCHSLVLTSRNRLLVCGDNSYGQLGLKDTKNRNRFIDALEGVLRTGETVLQIEAGYNHSLVLTSEQRLLVCGNNNCGQLGLEEIDIQQHFVDALEEVLLAGERVLQLAAGDSHTLVLTSQQRLLVCGYNASGQLGLGHTENQQRFTNALTAVLSAGEIVLQVRAGGYHSMVLTSQQRLLICGDNSCYQLGLTNESLHFIDVLPKVLPAGEIVLQVAAGEFHSLILTNQRLLLCGNNSCGQLGLGYAGSNQPGFVSNPLFDKQTLPVEPVFDLPPGEDEAQEKQTEESDTCYLC